VEIKGGVTEMVAVPQTRPMQRQGIFAAQRSFELTDDMAWYIEQVRQYPLLSKQEEIDLMQRIEQGNESARTTLIQSNLRLVISVARYYQRGDISLHDLIQEGNIGLMRATQTFNWRLGYKFSTYATGWIRQAITRALPGLEYMIHIPCYSVEKRNRLKRHFTNFTMQYGYEPGLEELAEIAGEKPGEIVLIWQHMYYMLSLDVPVADHEDVCLGDLIADEKATAEIDVEQDEISERVKKALACLTEREQHVIKLRFGIGADGRAHVLQEIARELGVTRERVRQIEEVAMRKLRKVLEK